MQYTWELSDTSYWCSSCHMPLCNVDRRQPELGREHSCEEEHLAPCSKLFGCAGQVLNFGFIKTDNPAHQINILPCQPRGCGRGTPSPVIGCGGGGRSCSTPAPPPSLNPNPTLIQICTPIPIAITRTRTRTSTSTITRSLTYNYQSSFYPCLIAPPRRWCSNKSSLRLVGFTTHAH
jgi:hypothetical protein